MKALAAEPQQVVATAAAEKGGADTNNKASTPQKNGEEESDSFSIEKSNEDMSNTRKSSLKEEFLSASALQSKVQNSQKRDSEDQFLIISQTQADQIDQSLLKEGEQSKE